MAFVPHFGGLVTYVAKVNTVSNDGNEQHFLNGDRSECSTMLPISLLQ